ncbi:hypothetical protein EV653_2409 [Kribbella pratensis]|jgi:hypothetical protein|uniref:DUF7144 domain-containing protein n=2 Tax=Kribbella pratensis TaxID=2512112 RepID=A0A4R8CMH5_9ACTN|nr:hypothetical protein EV653_2409 [Kribbella pratensis]
MTYSDLDNSDSHKHVPSGAVGGIAFAGFTLLIIGTFSTVAGLAAILDDDYLVVKRRYAFDLSTTAWGWIHLVLGIGAILVAGGVFVNKAWAGTVAIIVAGLIALDFFFFIPYQPAWSLVVIGLSAWIIWSITQARGSDV